jgi:lysophospholipase L1-like esterase
MRTVASWFQPFLLIAFTLVGTHAFGAVDQNILAERALLNSGDHVRLQRVFAKARRGETITIGAIGGSITQGARASVPARRYVDLVTAWWTETFPQAKVKLVNAGIGATGSHYGALRAHRDLLSHQPDFVIVDFAVNDRDSPTCTDTIEGLVRQILTQPNTPAVLMLFMMKQDGGNAQQWQAQVGAHYELPMISYRDALWPEIRTGRLKWTEISPDDIHPNDRGMSLAADFIVHFLARALREQPAETQLPEPKPVKEPLFTNRFEHVILAEGSELQPVSRSGWSYDENGQYWKADNPGSVIEFQAAGESVALTYVRNRGAMGRVKVQVDTSPPVILDGWFSGTWGSYRDTVTVADSLPAGSHLVRVELLADRDPESTGHEFRITGLGVAGVADH